MGILPFGNGLTLGELNDAEKLLFIRIQQSLCILYV